MDKQNVPTLGIPADLAEAIAHYLKTRPWIEVDQMMTALRQLKPVQETQPESLPAPDADRNQSRGL